MTFWKFTSKEQEKVAERVTVNPRLCKNTNNAYHDFTPDGACTAYGYGDGDTLEYLIQFGDYKDICQDEWWASENVTVSRDVHNGFQNLLKSAPEHDFCNIDCAYVATCTPSYTLFMDVLKDPTAEECRAIASANKLALSIGGLHPTDDKSMEYGCTFTPDTSRQDADFATVFRQFDIIDFEAIIDADFTETKD